MSHQSHITRAIRRADSDVQKMQRELKKIKYPVLAIEPAQQLRNKIDQFKNEKLVKEMKQKLIDERHLNSYRKIRGDGNCFFRALAYSYLASVRNLRNVKQTFYYLDDIQLTVCKIQSIPKQFRPFYNDKTLKQVLLNTWSIDIQFFSFACKNNNKRILSRLFRKNPYLDFIVILYFRSLCLKGYLKYQQHLKQFMKGTQVQEIKTYGQQSQGVILDICSRYMKICIQVYEVRKQGLKHYSYKQSNSLKGTMQVALLFYENHYDIVERIQSASLQQQKQDSTIVEEDYYTNIEENLVDGECIQCGDRGCVYEENFLCPKCFQISKNQLLNTVKEERYITGQCTYCGKNNRKILETVKICQNCVQEQNFIEKSPKKKAKYYCKTCHHELNQQDQCQKCSQSKVLGYCIDCKRKMMIQNQTKLCSQCKQHQSKIFRRAQQQKNMCKDCNQPVNSENHVLKCENKLTRAKISLKRTEHQQFSDQAQQRDNFEKKTCMKCMALKLDQKFTQNMCQKCYLNMKNKQQTNPSPYFQQSNPARSSILGSGINSLTQACLMCKKPAYTHKIQNGLCIACKNSSLSKVYF